MSNQLTGTRAPGTVVTGILAALLAGVCVAAGVDPGGAPAVARPWLRATVPGMTVGVAYFEITGGDTADELTGIRTAAAGHVEMHSSELVGGVMQMRELKSVPVPAHGRVSFAPGALHAMLIDLRAPLVEGRDVVLTLQFRRAGPRTVRAVTAGPGATAPPAAVEAHDGHP